MARAQWVGLSLYLLLWICLLRFEFDFGDEWQVFANFRACFANCRSRERLGLCLVCLRGSSCFDHARTELMDLYIHGTHDWAGGFEIKRPSSCLNEYEDVLATTTTAVKSLSMRYRSPISSRNSSALCCSKFHVRALVRRHCLLLLNVLNAQMGRPWDLA